MHVDVITCKWLCLPTSNYCQHPQNQASHITSIISILIYFVKGTHWQKFIDTQYHKWPHLLINLSEHGCLLKSGTQLSPFDIHLTSCPSIVSFRLNKQQTDYWRGWSEHSSYISTSFTLENLQVIWTHTVSNCAQHYSASTASVKSTTFLE